VHYVKFGILVHLKYFMHKYTVDFKDPWDV